jgi:hypothetical protein
MPEAAVTEEVQVYRLTAADAVLVAVVLFLFVWKLPQWCFRYLAQQRKRND